MTHPPCGSSTPMLSACWRAVATQTRQPRAASGEGEARAASTKQLADREHHRPDSRRYPDGFSSTPSPASTARLLAGELRGASGGRRVAHPQDRWLR